MVGRQEHGSQQPRRRAATLAEFDAADSVWNLAAAATETVDPFCSRTEWALSFQERMRPGRPLHVRTDGQSVIAFAETAHPRLGRLLEPIDSMWLFGNPLLGRGAVDLLVAMLAEPQLRDCPVLVSGLMPRGALVRQLLAALTRSHAFYALQPEHLRAASLAGGIDGWLSRRSGHFRRRLRAAARRAQQCGVSFTRHAPSHEAEAAALYQRMLRVEEQSWKGLGHCGMTEGGSRGFYEAMLRRLSASANGRVMFAQHGGADIGFIFGGLCGAVYRGQQFSFVDAWRSASIGNLLQWEQVQWLCEEGATRYDMGPAMEYKTHWTEVAFTSETCLLRRT